MGLSLIKAGKMHNFIKKCTVSGNQYKHILFIFFFDNLLRKDDPDSPTWLNECQDKNTPFFFPTVGEICLTQNFCCITHYSFLINSYKNIPIRIIRIVMSGKFA